MSVATRGARALAALGRCVRAPLRALVRARDLYVSRLAACAGGGRGPVGLVAVPRSQSHGFYRSAGSDDVRELIRAGGGGSRPAAGACGPPRSHSVAFGRIEEDRPCEFGMDGAELGPRSKSCVVGPTARTAAARRVAVGDLA